MNWYDVAETAVDEIIERDQFHASVLLTYLGHMKKGFWPQSYIDSMFQTWSDTYSIYDAHCFAELHTAIAAGTIARAEIYVGSEPHRDSHIWLNNRALQNLPKPFMGEFWGGTQDADGVLSWDVPVKLMVTPQNGGVYEITIPPATISLEVGYQKSTKSLLQLRRPHLGLARWPYGSKWITLFWLHED